MRLLSVLLVGPLMVACGGGDAPPPAETPPPAPPAAVEALEATDLVARGEQAYQQVCVTCHQANGEGVAGLYPPLAGSDWVSGNAAILVAIVLHGMQGPVTVNGVDWESVMPPWGASLTDTDVAAIVSYVRATYGNGAGAVQPADVAAIRAGYPNRMMWTASELRSTFPGG
jgi:mono/diheme cytochrome c family protein